MQLNKIKGLQMKTFSKKFEQNANLQLRKVTRAIDLYVKNVYIKSRLIRYVSSQAGFGMMQPLALKNFSDVVYSYLESNYSVAVTSQCLRLLSINITSDRITGIFNTSHFKRK